MQTPPNIPLAGFAGLELTDRLERLRQSIAGRIVFTTSFGLEDQALTHAIFSQGSEIEVVTLDTGRLFPETYALWAETEARYDRRIRPLYPRHDAVEALAVETGINGFYSSINARKACCQIRKVEPLARALAGADAWITGLRAGQSANRSGMTFVEQDRQRGLLKVNPLFDWDRERLVAYISDQNVPYNVLHDRGFPSIGCQPCTRSVALGEDERAGRWWWEAEDKKECGLHVHATAGPSRAA